MACLHCNTFLCSDGCFNEMIKPVARTCSPAGPAHQDQAYNFVECPMRAAAVTKGDIDPANMVPVQLGAKRLYFRSNFYVLSYGCLILNSF